MVDSKYPSAHKLHEFLQFDEECGPWIKRHIKALRMMHRREYFNATIPDAPVPKQRS